MEKFLERVKLFGNKLLWRVLRNALEVLMISKLQLAAMLDKNW